MLLLLLLLREYFFLRSVQALCFSFGGSLSCVLFLFGSVLSLRCVFSHVVVVLSSSTAGGGGGGGGSGSGSRTGQE